MKKLLSAFAVTACLAANAQTVTVTGHGVDTESAKQDAFRQATETVCGTVVLSDRSHTNSRTTLNKVTTYSSCRVDTYTILDRTDTSIKLRVELTKNQISQRLQTTGSNRAVFNHDMIATQFRTYTYQNKTGDELIDSVFRDYPYSAYQLKSEYHIITNNYRETLLEIPFEIRWNYKFIEALRDTFENFNVKGGYGHVTIMAKNPDAWILGKRTDYHIDDLGKLNYIKYKLNYENEMRLKVVARDTNLKQVVNYCYIPEYRSGSNFYSSGVEQKLVIYGNDFYKDTLRIKLSVPAESLLDIYTTIVPLKDCK